MAIPNSDESPMSVALFNKQVSDWINRLGRVWVEGQLSEVRIRPGYSLVFMRLRDVSAESSVSLVAQRDLITSMQPELTEGSRVVVYGKLEQWSKRGDLHLRAHHIRTVGIGELLARLEQLRTTLDAEGLFAADRKRPLPFLPRRVGLICGRNSEAQRDVMINARKRWPNIAFDVREVAVQGSDAVVAVKRAAEELDAQPEVDVIVITRGGGSVEDLLPFSDEGLIRAISTLVTPVVSAIGHERDRPLLDDVADFRASTPTDAARAIVPDVQEERHRVQTQIGHIRSHVRHRLETEQRALSTLRHSGALKRTQEWVAHLSVDVARQHADIRRIVTDLHERHAVQIVALRQALRALSPQATLKRGYAIVTNDHNTIATSPDDIAPGSTFQARLLHGTVVGVRPRKESP